MAQYTEGHCASTIQHCGAAVHAPHTVRPQRDRTWQQRGVAEPTRKHDVAEVVLAIPRVVKRREQRALAADLLAERLLHKVEHEIQDCGGVSGGARRDGEELPPLLGAGGNERGGGREQPREEPLLVREVVALCLSTVCMLSAQYEYWRRRSSGAHVAAARLRLRVATRHRRTVPSKPGAKARGSRDARLAQTSFALYALQA